MKLKNSILCNLLFVILFASCSQPSVEGGESSGSGTILSELPNKEEITQAVNSIIQKEGFSSIEELEFFEIGSSYTETIVQGSDPIVSVELIIVSKADKNKLMSYTYDFEDAMVSDGEEVSLSSGFGSNEEFVEGYDNFKSNLFTSNDFPPLSKMDEMKQLALDNSGYKKDDQYLSSYRSGFNNSGRFETYIYVKNKKSRTMSKPIYFDNKGQVK